MGKNEIDKEIAGLLDGVEYGEKIQADIIKDAKENGAVIVYGGRDDLMEFRGEIYDEFRCWKGCTAWIDQDGILENKCDNRYCPYFKKKISEAKMFITALWGDEGKYSWIYYTNIPHETFEMIEDGKKYCRGIVFCMSTLRGEIEK